MKYTKEVTEKIVEQYKNGLTAKEIALGISPDLPEKSVIAKLSQLGIYKKKVYVSKHGGPPIDKQQYIDIIAKDLKLDPDNIASLERVTKTALIILSNRISALVK